MLHLFNLVAIRFGVNAAWRAFAVWLPLLSLMAGAAAGAWGGYTVGRAPLLVDLATLKQDHTEALRLAQLAAAKRLQDAQTRSDSLALELGETIIQTTTLSQEKTDDLHLAATGRTCLDALALGVLNTSPGLRVAGLDGVPPPQPGLAQAHAAAGPDTHPQPGAPDAPRTPGLIATDADIGAWSIGAGAQYETCRQRLDALIDWHTIPGATP